MTFAQSPVPILAQAPALVLEAPFVSRHQELALTLRRPRYPLADRTSRCRLDDLPRPRSLLMRRRRYSPKSTIPSGSSTNIAVVADAASTVAEQRLAFSCSWGRDFRAASSRFEGSDMARSSHSAAAPPGRGTLERRQPQGCELRQSQGSPFCNSALCPSIPGGLPSPEPRSVTGGHGACVAARRGRSFKKPGQEEAP